VQLRFKTELTFEEYVKGEGWKWATLSTCPFHPEGGCGFAGHGVYMRKVPQVAWVARWYCPLEHATIGLLPDFYASRLPGTLDALEEAVARVETTESVEKAAAEVRPADTPDAVTLPTAVRWVRLRVQLVQVVLIAVLGLFPDRFAPATATVGHFRKCLQTARALVALRGIAEAYLHCLPMPLGLVPRSRHVQSRAGPFQQSVGSDGQPLSA
jgi:hypothetical protein